MTCNNFQNYIITGLQNLWQPGSRAARKWKENEKMERKWNENEEMERDSLYTFPHFLIISSLSIHFLYKKLSHFVTKCKILHFCRECHITPRNPQQLAKGKFLHENIPKYYPVQQIAKKVFTMINGQMRPQWRRLRSMCRGEGLR